MLNAAKPTTPNIRDFMDVREYLKAVYESRKASVRGFSYAQWATELGLKSRTFVRLVVIGKRSITENSIPLFIQGLKLNKSEADTFIALVGFTQATTQASRDRHANELAKRQAKRAHSQSKEIIDHYRFLSSHLCPRLQVLLTLNDLKRTSENLATLLGVSAARVTEMLDTLNRLGLATPTALEDGTLEWAATQKEFKLNDKLGDVALQSFHRKSLEDAITSIDAPTQTRNFQSVLVPLSPGEFEAMKSELQQFTTKLLAKYQSDEGQGKRLYQVNLNAIPVSAPVLREAKAQREPADESTGHLPYSQGVNHETLNH